ncbi:hypothetical protein [Novosphingobium sp. Chol11]|uniref:hypothetical protein n=1 Tax=Novosphingobium sp. Chol11 TaxID=1385763 RepID=UPI0025F81C7A|nr:hypothetical protein [Novosphingobium sp. Chol11]
MRIAVTGSNGKLGKAAVAALRKGGHRVTGFDIAASTYGDDTVRMDGADFGAIIAALCADRRDATAAAQLVSCAGQAAGRDDGRAVRALASG